jgi:hypothetical protein
LLRNTGPNDRVLCFLAGLGQTNDLPNRGGDSNDDGVLTACKLGYYLRSSVSTESANPGMWNPRGG